MTTAQTKPPRSPADIPVATEDYIIPRQEAAYAIGYQHGLADRMKLAQEQRGTQGAVNAMAATTKDASWHALLDGPLATQAADRGLEWVILTISALICLSATYMVLRLIWHWKGF